MNRIELQNVDIIFPVFNARSRGLLNTIFRNVHQKDARTNESGQRIVSVQALQGIRMKLENGDRLGLIGRNGSGKTTLLRVLSGVYEPLIGSAVIEGRVSSLTDIMLGMDLESSGYENIVLRFVCFGWTRRQALEAINDIREFSELGDLLELPVRTYSSGMLLRLAFAISTAIHPDILVMDEMIGAGDQHFVEKAKQRIERLMEKVGILALSSHDMSIIRRFCNRCVLLDRGRIVYAGETEECIARYLSSYA